MITLLLANLLAKKLDPDVIWLIIGIELMGEAFAVSLLIHFVFL